MDGFPADNKCLIRQTRMEYAKDRLNSAMIQARYRIQSRTDTVLRNATLCVSDILGNGQSLDFTYGDCIRRIRDLRFCLGNILAELDWIGEINSTRTSDEKPRRDVINICYGERNNTYDPRIEFHGFGNTVFCIEGRANVYFDKWYCKDDQRYHPDIAVYQVPEKGCYTFHLRVSSSCLKSRPKLLPSSCTFKLCHGKINVNSSDLCTFQPNDNLSGAVTEIREKRINLNEGELIFLKAASSTGRWRVEERQLDLVIIRN